MWQRRSLLVKLAGQTQLLEELAEISVDRLGAITCAADGVLMSIILPLIPTRAPAGPGPPEHLTSWFSLSLTALPGLAERPQLMTLWSECSGSAGLFHTTLDRVLQHMHQRYAAALQERHPLSADAGDFLLRQRLHLTFYP